MRDHVPSRRGIHRCRYPYPGDWRFEVSPPSPSARSVPPWAKTFRPRPGPVASRCRVLATTKPRVARAGRASGSGRSWTAPPRRISRIIPRPAIGPAGRDRRRGGRRDSGVGGFQHPADVLGDRIRLGPRWRGSGRRADDLGHLRRGHVACRFTADLASVRLHIFSPWFAGGGRLPERRRTVQAEWSRRRALMRWKRNRRSTVSASARIQADNNVKRSG